MEVMMKKWDKIIIVILLVISFLPYLFVKTFLIGSYDKTYAYITVNGELYKEVPLTGQVKHKEFIIDTGHGTNKIVIENESIGVVEADCSDGICEEFGFISKPGEIIVCLPHSVYIEVRGQQEEKDDEIDMRAY